LGYFWAIFFGNVMQALRVENWEGKLKVKNQKLIFWTFSFSAQSNKNNFAQRGGNKYPINKGHINNGRVCDA
jgi:hypothetical protein